MMGGLYHLQILDKKVSKIKRAYIQNRDGFTIVETMVVLAVTGILFASVVAVTSGRQGKAQFQQSVNAVKTEIEQVISEVQSGYYPNTENFNCTKNAAGVLTITDSTAGNEQGANKDCVFLGKAIQFSVSGTNPESYAVYPIAGLRMATSFADSGAKAIGQSTETRVLQYGTVPKWVQPATGSRVGALGFVTTFSASSDGTDAQGSQSIQIVPVPGSILNSTVDTARATIDASIAAGASVNGAKICYQSGTTDQHGIVSITGGGSVSLKIENGGCPA